MSIPFVDLKSQYKRIEKDVRRRIDDVLDHGKFIMGPEVRELEEALANYVGVEHAIACSSGTDALLLALMAYGVGPGDAVFTTPFTFVATAEVIALLGATPVFVDIDPVTYNLDADCLARAVDAVKKQDESIYPIPRIAKESSLNPRGVIAVDLYGLPADYDRLRQVCGESGLFLIEDGAQSFGAQYKSRKACSLGDVGTTSFFPAKPLGCYGDGGMVFTDRDDLADVIRSLVVHGKGENKYDNVRVGLNARLDTLQAAIVLAKLEVFDEELERRQVVASEYERCFASSAGNGVTVPKVPEGVKSAWAQYTLRMPTDVVRDKAVKALGAEGVPAAVYYPKPLHLQEAFGALGYGVGDLPTAEEASRTVLSVPFGPYVDPNLCGWIAEMLSGSL